MPQTKRRFTDFSGFTVRSVSSPSSWWCLRWGMPPGILPLPPRRGGVFRPILVVRFILRFLEATQGWQRFLEVKTMRVGTHTFRTYPPISTTYVEFFFCRNMGVGLCSPICLSISRITSSVFQYGFSEPCVTNESIGNVLVFSFCAFLLELILPCGILGDLRLCVCQAPGAFICVSPCGSILGPVWVHLGSKNRYLDKNQFYKNQWQDKNQWTDKNAL